MVRYQIDQVLDFIYSAGATGIRSGELARLTGVPSGRISSKLGKSICQGLVRAVKDGNGHNVFYWRGGERKVGAPSLRGPARAQPRPCRVCGAPCKPGNVSCSPEHAEILMDRGRRKGGERAGSKQIRVVKPMTAQEAAERIMQIWHAKGFKEVQAWVEPAEHVEGFAVELVVRSNLRSGLPPSLAGEAA